MSPERQQSGEPFSVTLACLSVIVSSLDLILHSFEVSSSFSIRNTIYFYLLSLEGPWV